MPWEEPSPDLIRCRWHPHGRPQPAWFGRPWQALAGLDRLGQAFCSLLPALVGVWGSKRARGRCGVCVRRAAGGHIVSGTISRPAPRPHRNNVKPRPGSPAAPCKPRDTTRMDGASRSKSKGSKQASKQRIAMAAPDLSWGKPGGRRALPICRLHRPPRCRPPAGRERTLSQDTTVAGLCVVLACHRRDIVLAVDDADLVRLDARLQLRLPVAEETTVGQYQLCRVLCIDGLEAKP